MLGFLLAPVDYLVVVNSIGTFLRDDLGLTMIRDRTVEGISNVLLFIPVGLLLVLRLRRPWVGLTAALVISLGVEVTQSFIPSRVTSLRDIVANTFGALVGAAIAWWVVRRRPASSATALPTEWRDPVRRTPWIDGVHAAPEPRPRRLNWPSHHPWTRSSDPEGSGTDRSNRTEALQAVPSPRACQAAPRRPSGRRLRGR